MGPNQTPEGTSPLPSILETLSWHIKRLLLRALGVPEPLHWTPRDQHADRRDTQDPGSSRN